MKNVKVSIKNIECITSQVLVGHRVEKGNLTNPSESIKGDATIYRCCSESQKPLPQWRYSFVPSDTNCWLLMAHP